MSEYDDPKTTEETPEAKVHLAKWGPWVWIVPALAILFVGWLIVRYGFFGGGDITVRFVEARGLDRYSPVRYRGAKVGTVQKITIDDELKQVVVRISMDAAMKGALNKGTRFWIVEPGLESGGLGGILGGTYVGISPGTGEETREFQGQEYPPILSAPEAGKTYILEAQGAGSIGIGAPVLFDGIRVGRVLGAEYDATQGLSKIHIFIVQRYADQVKQSTRFYRAGGFSVSFEGGKLSMGDASLSSLLTSGVSFYTPEVLAGAPVAEKTVFELYKSRAEAIASAEGPHMTYLTYFPGAVGGLTPGTPVQIKGIQVGRVRDVRLRYIRESATLETPVTIEIDPRRLEIEIPPGMTRIDARQQMNDALNRLIQKGMRARLATSLILPGAGAVTLETVAKPGTGSLILTSDPPIIPAVGNDRGLENALAALNRVAARIDSLPLTEIAANMRSAAARVDALVNDPSLDQSLRSMNAALRDIESAANKVEGSVDPIVNSLRRAAESAESAAGRANQLLGSSARQNYDLGELVKELTRAAESVRALADYLAEHPDSLLKGRPK